MRYSEQLRKEADPIFEAIIQHPFVQGIGQGKLESAQLIHYVKQDYEYLNAYMRVYGLAISKCEDREDMAMFTNKMGFILNSEIHPHHNFCRAAGVKYEDVQGYPLAPTALHYTRHMLTVAHQGSLGEIVAVLLPCPWTYFEIGQRLIEQYQPTDDHPFHEWITFYGQPDMEPRVQQMIDRMDAWAETASEKEKEKMKKHFMLSCQLEYMFFDMAYKIEEWPVEV